MILGFTLVILMGALLLMLPFATVDGYKLSFIDALFTSTSAVCITGLLSVPTITTVYTLFGKIVIVFLIEIGGLGFITIATFIFSLLGVKIGMKDRFLIKESLNQNSLKGMVRLVRMTVTVALTVQLIGAIINYIVFSQDYNFWSSVGISVFHAVSAFNNCGFDLFSGGVSLTPYRDNVLLNLNTTALIIIGGIGFIVIYDILKNKSWKHLSIHTKIVLKTSLLLIIVGTILLKIGEGNNITWLQAYFNSVSARTAGFATVNFNTFTNVSLLVMMILMFIGASPASTGGGIKTTSFYTIYKSISSFARGKDPISHNRKVASSSVMKAYVLTISAIAAIIICALVISFIETFNPNATNDAKYLVKILFETVSAFGTVGNSMGLTPSLHWLSKLILCLLMFFGRLGPITIISVWNKHWTVETYNGIKYIEEKMIIG
jgi:trk system potassium uptake protein TrkH